MHSFDRQFEGQVGVKQTKSRNEGDANVRTYCRSIDRSIHREYIVMSKLDWTPPIGQSFRLPTMTYSLLYLIESLFVLCLKRPGVFDKAADSRIWTFRPFVLLDILPEPGPFASHCRKPATHFTVLALFFVPC